MLFDAFNGINLGRVQTCVAMPGLEGKVTGVDIAEERASSYIFAQEIAGAWIGGVNERGLGAAFSFDWPDVDAMQMCMYKTVGSTYHVVMRRRSVAGRRLDHFPLYVSAVHGIGIAGRHAGRSGGRRAGRSAGELRRGRGRGGIEAGRDAAGESVSGQRCRAASLQARPMRAPRRQRVVLEETRPVALKVAETATLETQLRLGPEGLYVLSVTATGDGVPLSMEKPLEVGKTKLVYKATPPAGEKRGVRDGGIGLGTGEDESAIQDDRSEFRHAASAAGKRPCPRAGAGVLPDSRRFDAGPRPRDSPASGHRRRLFRRHQDPDSEVRIAPGRVGRVPRATPRSPSRRCWSRWASTGTSA